jgi:hypothetical protein
LSDRLYPKYPIVFYFDAIHNKSIERAPLTAQAVPAALVRD